MDRRTIELEKELTGKTVKETFFELRKEIDERFSEIKERYLNSRIKSKGDTFIETILSDSDKIYNFRESYYPVIEKKYSITELEDEFYLNEVYIDISYNQLEDIVQEEYEAWINIAGENYEMKVVFEHDGRYQSKIGRLYEAFKLNGKKWKTVNMAHFKRMYRIKVVRYDFRMTKELYEKIKENKDETVYGFGIYDKNALKWKAFFKFVNSIRKEIVYLFLLIIGILTLELFFNSVERNSKKRQDNFSILSNSILNFVRGMQTIKAFNMQKEKGTAVNKDIELTKKGALDYVYDAKISGFLSSLGNSLPIGFMIISISYLMFNNNIDKAYGIGFIVFSFILFVPLTILKNAAEVLGISDASIERYNEVMNETELKENKDNQFIPKKMNIEFKNVNFAYEKKEVLKDINLKKQEFKIFEKKGRDLCKIPFSPTAEI